MIKRYAVATLGPWVLLMAAAFFGPPFAVLALIWLTLGAALLDPWLDPPSPSDPPDIWAERLSIILAIAHLTLIPVLLWGLLQPTAGFGGKLAMLLAAASWFGQISHPNGHELIHRRGSTQQRLGAAIYTTMLFGHHVSAHKLVHHAYVGTENDPATPLHGESFWAYVARAWAGGFQAGLEAENDLLARKGEKPQSLRHPYLVWVTGGVLTCLFVLLAFNLGSLIVFLMLCGLVHLQILISDYIQHYGLQRLILPSGRPEPIAAHHSWNAPRGFSSLLMLNAPSHSEHHMHPDRAYDTLQTEGLQAPRLPYAMPIMAVIACIPALWFRVMDRRAVKVMRAAQERLEARYPSKAPDRAQTESDLRDALLSP